MQPEDFLYSTLGSKALIRTPLCIGRKTGTIRELWDISRKFSICEEERRWPGLKPEDPDRDTVFTAFFWQTWELNRVVCHQRSKSALVCS